MHRRKRNMHTVDTFLTRHPAFADVDLALISACLDAAAEEVDAEVFGARTNEAHGLLTAHKLAMDPMGLNARLILKDGTPSTTYWPQWLELVQANCSGFRVT
jgi:hypothetical protein